MTDTATAGSANDSPAKPGVGIPIGSPDGLGPSSDAQDSRRAAVVE